MKKKEIYLLVLLIIVSAVLRLSSLGYSHFYGDETKTLYLDKTISATDFLFGQRKGPVQFLVVWGVEKLTGGFNEQAVRFPFALAGLLSVGVFYILVKKIFTWREALVASTLFALSGFNIAFSRTAQYQSILILVGLLSIFFIYQYSLASKHRYIYLMLGSVFLGISFLTHYDAVFFAIPCVFIFYKNARLTKINFKEILLFTLPCLVLLAAFYVPYIFNGNFANNTFNYLSRRASGDTYLPNNSIYTAKVYNPYLIGFIPLFFAFFFLLRPISWKKAIIFVWFIVPYILFEYLFRNPGTHINNYYLPLYIIASVGFVQVIDSLPKSFFRPLLNVGLIIIFIVYGFINTSVYLPGLRFGYPWHNGNIDKNYHLYLYGFPYYRAWDQVQAYFSETDGIRNFYTNDNNIIASYYLRKYDLTPPGTNYLPQYYVYIKDSQEFREPSPEFLSSYSLEKEFQDALGIVLAQVYKLSLK